MDFKRDALKIRAAKYQTLISAFGALAASVQPRTIGGFAAMALHDARVVRHMPTFFEFAKTIGASIDDRLDPLSCQTIEQFGEVRAGRDPSPFIQNENVVTPAEWRTFRDLDRYGLMPLPLTIAFCNALAEKLMEEKRACDRAAGHPEWRPGIRQSHLELSELSVAFFTATINPAARRAFEDATMGITSDTVATLLPDTTRVGAILQLHDDMTDMVRDMRDEVRTGAIVANGFLSGLGEAGLEDCADFIARQLPAGNAYVAIGTFPQAVQNHWQAVRAEANGIADEIASATARRETKRLMNKLDGPLVEPDSFAAREPETRLRAIPS